MDTVDEITKIKQILINSCYSTDKRNIKRCGCEDVKIHFSDTDITADFLTYDSNGDAMGYYVIKTSVSDIFSINPKSFRGNYNYLVITRKMWESIRRDKSYFDNLIPDFVGIVICDTEVGTTSCIRYTKRQSLSAYNHSTLKDSLVYTLFSKWQKVEKKYNISLHMNKNSALTTEDLDKTISHMINNEI